jgi:hypothetical protein
MFSAAGKKEEKLRPLMTKGSRAFELYRCHQSKGNQTTLPPEIHTSQSLLPRLATIRRSFELYPLPPIAEKLDFSP